MIYYVINAEFNEIIFGPTSEAKAIAYLKGITMQREVYQIVKIVFWGSDFK